MRGDEIEIVSEGKSNLEYMDVEERCLKRSCAVSTDKSLHFQFRYFLLRCYYLERAGLEFFPVNLMMMSSTLYLGGAFAS